jgi:hypothetical protein
MTRLRLRIAGQFMVDLMSGSDAGFARRIIRHVIDESGHFIDSARHDHKYAGIDGAWIRYASEGGSAYRVIYLKRGNAITLYRAGLHKVEDRLTDIKESEDILDVVEDSEQREDGDTEELATMYGQLLSSRHRVSAWKKMHSMFHVKHREIYLVSPYLTEALLEATGILGRYLDRAIEDHTCVALITAPPDSRDALYFFQRLEARGVLIYFYKRLHSKLYYFDVDITALPAHFRFVTALAIVGSANLTAAGFGIDCPANEELCYQIPAARMADTKAYIDNLIHDALDLATFRSQA